MDIILAAHLNISRSKASSAIKNKLIFVDDVLVQKPSTEIKIGQKIDFSFLKNKDIDPVYDIKFDVEILYEDEAILVLNKPPFVAVHPAVSLKEASLCEWLKLKKFKLSSCTQEGREGIVHRLDKETSGVLIVAKNDFAHEYLATQLRDKSMGRYYLGIIDCPLREDVLVDLPLDRSKHNPLRRTFAKDGKEAKSLFCKLQTSLDGKIELIGAKLFTGRTHQIRAHLKTLNRHILGDKLYGYQSKGNFRVMLHAYCLYFRHPISKNYMLIEAPLYDDFLDILNKRFLSFDMNKDNLISRLELNINNK